MVRDRVLIIEEDRRTVDQLQEHLEVMGYEAEVALSGRIGLAIVTERKMSAAVLDANVDGGEAWDILRAIKRKDPDLLVVLINGRARKGESRMARRAGATRFMRSPSDPEKVIHAVHQVLAAD